MMCRDMSAQVVIGHTGIGSWASRNWIEEGLGCWAGEQAKVGF